MPEKFSEIDDEPIPPPPWWVRAGRISIALVALAGILYFSSGYQYFFFHKTPPGAEQKILTSKVNAEQITIPVIVHILTGAPGSERTAEDAHRLIENANNIWTQANISFAIEDILYHPVTNDDLRTFDREPHTFITNSATYHPEVANLYLTRTLSGVNGLAYGGTNAIAVADYTANLDYRTLAHEFGHFLGLGHVTNPKQLMSSGATGVDLSMDEITAAHKATQDF